MLHEREDITGKTWEYRSPSSSPQQDTALAPRWHGNSGSSTIPRSGKPEQVLHVMGQQMLPVCPAWGILFLQGLGMTQGNCYGG